MIELHQPDLTEMRALLLHPEEFRGWPVVEGALPPRPILDQSRHLMGDSALLMRWALPFLIVLVEEGVIVGNIGGKGLLPGEEDIELGYSVARRYRGRKIVTQAIGKVVELAVADGLIPIAHVEPENEASQRALGRNGFSLSETFSFPASLELQRWRWSAD